MSRRDVSTFFIEMKCRSPGAVLSAQGYASFSGRPRGPIPAMLVAQPLAVPCGGATMESYLPLLSLKLAEDCQSGSARQGTVDLFRESFPDASISYVGCVKGPFVAFCRTRSGLRTFSTSDLGAARCYALPFLPVGASCRT